MTSLSKGLPKMALFLGYGGLTPFVVLSLISIFGFQISLNLSISIEIWLAIYAAVIISFLGAIHWGLVLAKVDELSDQESNTLLLYSVIPSLLAWFTFLFEIKTCLFLMAFIVIVCFVVDCLILFKKLDAVIAKSFKRLRLHLTIIVSVSLFIAAINIP